MKILFYFHQIVLCSPPKFEIGSPVLDLWLSWVYSWLCPSVPTAIHSQWDSEFTQRSCHSAPGFREWWCRQIDRKLPETPSLACWAVENATVNRQLSPLPSISRSTAHARKSHLNPCQLVRAIQNYPIMWASLLLYVRDFEVIAYVEVDMVIFTESSFC